MTPTPDFAGFAEAMNRHRVQSGVLCHFHVPVAEVWDPGEQIDPETQRPFDPFAAVTAGGGVTIEDAVCSFVARPLTGRVATADIAETPLGMLDTGSEALIVTPTDYDRVKAARRVTVGVEDYDIAIWREDIVWGYTRYVAFMDHA